MPPFDHFQSSIASLSTFRCAVRLRAIGVTHWRAEVGQWHDICCARRHGDIGPFILSDNDDTTDTVKEKVNEGCSSCRNCLVKRGLKQEGKNKCRKEGFAFQMKSIEEPGTGLPRSYLPILRKALDDLN